MINNETHLKKYYSIETVRKAMVLWACRVFATDAEIEVALGLTDHIVCLWRTRNRGGDWKSLRHLLEVGSRNGDPLDLSSPHSKEVKLRKKVIKAAQTVIDKCAKIMAGKDVQLIPGEETSTRIMVEALRDARIAQDKELEALRKLEGFVFDYEGMRDGVQREVLAKVVEVCSLSEDQIVSLQEVYGDFMFLEAVSVVS